MTSFNVTAPSGTSLVGNCPEWIVESPTITNNQVTTVGPFGVVYFDDAFAGTVKKAQLDGGNATLITMVRTGSFWRHRRSWVRALSR